MTRSTAETAKVTPHALMHCRSNGASSRIAGDASKAAVIGKLSSGPSSSPGGIVPDHALSSSATVGALRDTSRTRPFATTTGRARRRRLDGREQRVAPILRKVLTEIHAWHRHGLCPLSSRGGYLAG